MVGTEGVLEGVTGDGGSHEATCGEMGVSIGGLDDPGDVESLKGGMGS